MEMRKEDSSGWGLSRYLLLSKTQDNELGSWALLYFDESRAKSMSVRTQEILADRKRLRRVRKAKLGVGPKYFLFQHANRVSNRSVYPQGDYTDACMLEGY